MTTTPRSAPTSPLLTPEQTANLLNTTPAALKAERAGGRAAPARTITYCGREPSGTTPPPSSGGRTGRHT